MHKIALFCEDSGHELYVKALIEKIATPVVVHVFTLSSRFGKGRALSELGRFLQDIENGKTFMPDAIVAAIDANCRGYNEKRNEINALIPEKLQSLPLIHAIPDPHIERWMLVDSRAFKQVFGVGCAAPDQKCAKDRYKDKLKNAIKAAGGTALLGGMEYAEEIVYHTIIQDLKRSDESLKRFIEELETLFKRWMR